MADKPVPFEKFKADWLHQVGADNKLSAGALRAAIAISAHMSRKQAGLA